jgi:RNA polymerase sigma factor (sigma-70 family)
VKTGSTEEQLLAGLAQNDKKAVETLYRDHFGMVQAFILNNNGNGDDARDVFQEAMIVLYEKATSGHFQLTAQIKTYLYSVSRRVWLKRLQHMQRFGAPVESMVELAQVDEDLEAHERHNDAFTQMERALAHLGEPCKGLLEAYYLQKKNMAEIADQFGYTNAENAKNQKYKCLARLKRIFHTQYKSGS